MISRHFYTTQTSEITTLVVYPDTVSGQTKWMVVDNRKSLASVTDSIEFQLSVSKTLKVRTTSSEFKHEAAYVNLHENISSLIAAVVSSNNVSHCFATENFLSIRKRFSHHPTTDHETFPRQVASLLRLFYRAELCLREVHGVDTSPILRRNLTKSNYLLPKLF